MKDFIQTCEEEFEKRRFNGISHGGFMTNNIEGEVFHVEALKAFHRQSINLCLEELRKRIESIDVSGGGSGRRLKIQLLKSLETKG